FSLILQTVQYVEAVVSKHILGNKKLFSLKDHNRLAASSVIGGVDIIQIHVTFSHYLEHGVQAAHLVFKVYGDHVCHPVHISGFCKRLRRFLRIVGNHTEQGEFRRVETCETIDVDPVSRQKSRNLLQASRFIRHKNNILLYHNNHSSSVSSGVRPIIRDGCRRFVYYYTCNFGKCKPFLEFEKDSSIISCRQRSFLLFCDYSVLPKIL